LDADQRVLRGVIGREGSHITAILAANRGADRGETGMLGSARSTVYAAVAIVETGGWLRTG